MNTTLSKSKAIANKYGADLAIPNCEGSGIGNALMYTRLVEEYSRLKGKPLKIFTGPLLPSVGIIDGEDPFCIWRNNPYVDEIMDAKKINERDLEIVNNERHSLVQLNHIIENICWVYGVRPRELRCSIFLTTQEMQWALNELKHLQRPLVCLHPGGNTKSSTNSPWHKANWLHLIERMSGKANFFKLAEWNLVIAT